MRRARLLLASLALLLAAACRDRREATLLFITDAHEIAPVVDAHGDRGGVARLKTVVDGLKRRDPETLLVFGGDLAGGTLFGGVFRGEPMVDALGRAGVGLASFGQHDFDFGAEHARRLVARSRFPWITSNLVDPAGKPFGSLPTRLVRRVGGLRVGFVGLTADMQLTTQEGSVVQRDLVEAARAESEALKREGAEAIVAITQAGPELNQRLLLEVPALDAILTEEESEVRSVVRFGGHRPVAAPCGNLGSIVELRLWIEPGAAKVMPGTVRSAVLAHPVDASVPPDPELAAEERVYTGRLEAQLADPVATLAGELPSETSRSSETSLGNLVADALRSAAGAQVGIVAGSSLRAGLPAGGVTRRHVLAVLPFGNRVTLLELTGGQVRAALEEGLAGKEAGGIMQVSGLTYAGDPKGLPYARLLDVRVDGRPLDDAARYRVAVSSYLASGGEGLHALAGAARLPIPGGDPLDVDALATHLSGLGRSGPVEAPPMGRIRLEAGSVARRR